MDIDNSYMSITWLKLKLFKKENEIGFEKNKKKFLKPQRCVKKI